MRGRRMLAHGDLRLIALALIAEQPRHGYDIIKQLEERTAEWYSPSPGIVYPTLTYLEEVGHLTSQTDGPKKLYSITESGRRHLEENAAAVDVELGTPVSTHRNQRIAWSALLTLPTPARAHREGRRICEPPKTSVYQISRTHVRLVGG